MIDKTELAEELRRRIWGGAAEVDEIRKKLKGPFESEHVKGQMFEFNTRTSSRHGGMVDLVEALSKKFGLGLEKDVEAENDRLINT